MYIKETISITQLSLNVGFVCFGVVRWRIYIDLHCKHMFYSEYLNLLANEPSDLIWGYTNPLPFTIYDLRKKLNLKTANARCIFVVSNISYVYYIKTASSEIRTQMSYQNSFFWLMEVAIAFNIRGIVLNFYKPLFLEIYLPKATF